MNNYIISIHSIFALLFTLYIILDRAYIRVFINEEKREAFYKKVKFPMLFICTILFLSGIYLVINFFSNLIIIKAVLATILIVSFFYCPIFMKKQCSPWKRFMYRYWIVLLTLLTVVLGLYI